MVPHDSRAAAAQAAGMLRHNRMRHFFDPEKQLGQAVADSLMWTGQIASDIYLFYAPGQKWEALPPPPVRYAHQLTNAWADRDHYRVAADLSAELQLSMEKMVQDQGKGLGAGWHV